ncbi:MAG: hypothetical protein KGL39_09630 [Patescibacteria group bacterium]|nr:hypothetical protein [Patescibacteria group bacterium]
MGILSLLIGPVSKLLDRVLPDPKIAEQAKAKLMDMQAQGALVELDGEMKETLAAAGIVQAEAQSKHWLAADWRPLIMLLIAAALVAHLLGWTPAYPNDPEFVNAWDVLKIGLGGYVVMHPSSLNALGGAIKAARGK